MKELLEAGVHFGHQTRRWNPKMKEYIFGERNGIHIIDLQKTLKMFREASRFVSEISAQGRTVLFVGTKRQAQEAVAEEAKRCGAYFVNHRWLGGTLTNWATLQKSIKRLKLLKAMSEDGRMAELSKKEKARLDREMKHLLPEPGRHREHDAAAGCHVRDRFQRRRNRREGSAPHGRAGGFGGGYELRSRRGGLDHSGQRRRVARDSLVHLEDFRVRAGRPQRLSAIAGGGSESGADQALVDGVEYVDTSAYEQYEKQEGDFVEGVVGQLDVPVEPAEFRGRRPPKEARRINRNAD